MPILIWLAATRVSIAPGIGVSRITFSLVFTADVELTLDGGNAM